MSLSLKLIVLFTLLSACAPDNGQVGEETIQCKVTSIESLQRNQESALGFSVDTILAFAEGEHTGPLQWDNGESTRIHITLTYTGNANYQTREWQSESDAEPATDPDLDCLNVVELEMTASVTTDDGALNESWPIQLQATTAELATLYYKPTTFSGTIVPATFVPTGDFTQYDFFANFTFRADSTSGTLTGQAETDTNADTASVVSFDIASFDF